MYAWGHGFSIEESKEWLEKQLENYRKYGFGFWAVLDKESEQIIGNAGLNKESISLDGVEKREIVELGYILAKEFWGKGIATEIARAVSEYAFKNLGLEKLYCLIKEDNFASMRVARKLGGRIIGENIKKYKGQDLLHYIFECKGTELVFECENVERKKANSETIKEFKEREQYKMDIQRQSMQTSTHIETTSNTDVIYGQDSSVALDSLCADTDSTLQSKKSYFLNALKGKNLHYKRYTKSPLRYGGGKSLAVGLIIEHFPNDIKRVISPFLGGGSVEVASALELGLEVKAFDIFDILVNFWQLLLKDSKALYESLHKLEPTKENYAMIKEELKAFWNERHKNPANKPLVKLNSLTLARDYYFNFNLSYGPGFLGWMSTIYEDKGRYLKALEKVRDFGTHKNAKNLSVECASFETIFEKYPEDFFYLDPPYFLEGDSKMFKGIYPMRNFPIHHNAFNHELLSELLKKHKGRFILSYNDCKFVREAYKDFKILEPRWQYTMGQGEKRIGKNRIERGDDTNVKNSHELLIIKD